MLLIFVLFSRKINYLTFFSRLLPVSLSLSSSAVAVRAYLLLGSSLFSSPDLLHTLVKAASNLSLSDAEPSFRRNIDGTVSTNRGVLATKTPNAKTKRLADLLSLGISTVSGQVRQLDVDRSPHTSAHVSRTRGDHTKVGRLSATAGDQVFDVVDGGLQPLENVVDDG